MVLTMLNENLLIRGWLFNSSLLKMQDSVDVWKNSEVSWRMKAHEIRKPWGKTRKTPEDRNRKIHTREYETYFSLCLFFFLLTFFLLCSIQPQALSLSLLSSPSGERGVLETGQRGEKWTRQRKRIEKRGKIWDSVDVILAPVGSCIPNFSVTRVSKASMFSLRCPRIVFVYLLMEGVVLETDY